MWRKIAKFFYNLFIALLGSFIMMRDAIKALHNWLIFVNFLDIIYTKITLTLLLIPCQISFTLTYLVLQGICCVHIFLRLYLSSRKIKRCVWRFTGSAAPRQKNNRLPSINSQQKNPKAKLCNKFPRQKHQHVNFQLKVNASMFFCIFFHCTNALFICL
jgi:hypothetical protein